MAQVRAELLRHFRDDSDPALRQALGRVVLPPREACYDDPARWWQHVEVNIDPDAMPIAMSLSLAPGVEMIDAVAEEESPFALTSSWFGGTPAVLRSEVAGWVPPRRADGTELTHVIQVDLAQESSNQGPETFARLGLPAGGMVQVFHDLSTEGWDEETDPSAWQVRWIPAGDEYGVDPADLTLAPDHGAPAPMTPVNPQVIPTVPNPLEPKLDDASDERYQRAYDWLEELPHEMNTMLPATDRDVDDRATPWDDGYEALPAMTRMTGHPAAERTEETLQILNDRLPLTTGTDEHVLLLGLNVANFGDPDWFHGGCPLEVWIRRTDLDARSFDQVWCLIRTDA